MKELSKLYNKFLYSFCDYRVCGGHYVRGLLDCFRPFYVTLSSTSPNHVRHTRKFSTYIGNVSGDKANSYYVRINLACPRSTLLRLFEVSFKLFAS